MCMCEVQAGCGGFLNVAKATKAKSEDSVSGDVKECELVMMQA